MHPALVVRIAAHERRQEAVVGCLVLDTRTVDCHSLGAVARNAAAGQTGRAYRVQSRAWHVAVLTLPEH